MLPLTHDFRDGSCVTKRSWSKRPARNFMGDEGRSFGFGDQVADPKPPQAALVKSHGGERCGKRWDGDPGRYG